MPAIDEQTRRMARLLGATDEEIEEDVEAENDEALMSKSFYSGDGRMSVIVGLEADQDREKRTQK